MYRKFRQRLISIYLVITARAYYVISNKGASLELPEERPVLEALQDELDDMDRYLEDTIMELILEERDTIE
jgi:hypothetical protein